MPIYRAFELDFAGRISQPSITIEANNDQDARHQAGVMQFPYGGELWQKGRLVSCLPAGQVRAAITTTDMIQPHGSATA